MSFWKRKKGKDANEQTFIEHLDDLRGHLLRSLIAVGVGFVLAMVNYKFLFDQILFSIHKPSFPTNRFFCWVANKWDMPALCINENHLQLQNLEVGGQFMAHFSMSFVAGIILAAPYILWEFWKFIKPGLTSHEVKYSKGILFYISILFFSGVLFGYFLIDPLAINFLSNYTISDSIANIPSFRSYTSMVSMLTLSTGIMFELPVVIYFLTKIGIATPDNLRKFRRYAFVILLVLSGIITPPDVLSQVLVCLPLYVLYEISILISKRVYRKKQQEEQEEQKDKLRFIEGGDSPNPEDDAPAG